jgi:Flp pilus assembly protein TadB
MNARAPRRRPRKETEAHARKVWLAAALLVYLAGIVLIVLLVGSWDRLGWAIVVLIVLIIGAGVAWGQERRRRRNQGPQEPT